MTMTSTTPSAPTLQFSSLLGSTIESIIHELLYSRSIYPPDSFVLHRHLGVRCHASRVPQVCDYVSDFLRVAIPSVTSGVGDGIVLIILEELCFDGNGDGSRPGERDGSTKAVERFEFRFCIDRVVGGGGGGGGVGGAGGGEGEADAMLGRGRTMDIEDMMQCAAGRDAELAVAARSDMERSMRECLLRVLALRRRRRGEGERAENMSFKLCLHVAAGGGEEGVDDGRRDDESCPDLMRALRRGEWLRPEESSCLFSSNSDGHDRRKGLLRPIKDVDLPSCGMKMQLGMEVNPFR
ncbi:hypothetical protein ACHAW5_009621 [Stephanodiscus triporus]|uniref:HORMA domain-containing protein n=1 Tax=Stephanodiscus triporus TaxID=2934178 RepID=A0ABD3NQZ3_9STRA